MEQILRLVKPLRPWWKEIAVGVVILGVLMLLLVRRRSTEGFQTPPPEADIPTLCAKYILQRDSLADQKRGFEISGNDTMARPLEAGIQELNKKIANLNCSEKIKQNAAAAEIVATGSLPVPPSNVNQIISEAKPAVEKASAAIPVPAT